MSSDPTIMQNDYPRVDKELYKKNPRAAFAKWEQLFTTYLAAQPLSDPLRGVYGPDPRQDSLARLQELAGSYT